MIDPLARIIAEERCRELLGALTGRQLVIAWLRLQDWSMQEIGEHLDMSTQLVSRELKRARVRMEQAVPEAAGLLAGRETRYRGRKSRGGDGHGK